MPLDSSDPAIQSLVNVQVTRVNVSDQGPKGLWLGIMSQSCVRVRAGASVQLHACSWLIIRNLSPYSPLRAAQLLSDLRE